MSTMSDRIVVEIGYALHKAYGGSRARKHAVEERGNGLWFTRCNERRATHEYKGFHTTITCQDCKGIIAKENSK